MEFCIWCLFGNAMRRFSEMAASICLSPLLSLVAAWDVKKPSFDLDTEQVHSLSSKTSISKMERSPPPPPPSPSFNFNRDCAAKIVFYYYTNYNQAFLRYRCRSSILKSKIFLISSFHPPPLSFFVSVSNEIHILGTKIEPQPRLYFKGKKKSFLKFCQGSTFALLSDMLAKILRRVNRRKKCKTFLIFKDGSNFFLYIFKG